MKYEPYEYQTYATEFILEHPEAAIFLQMGLGKSVITLTALRELMTERKEIRKALVIAPLRVGRDTWPAEIRKWDHLREMTFSVAIGPEAARRAALRENTMIHIINRENLPWLIEESGATFDYDMIIVDELSSFKNHQTKRFRSLMKVRERVKRIVGLTGTPSDNGLMDLFAEYRVLDMGKRLGKYFWQYRNAFFTPEKTNGTVVYSYRPKPGAEEEIYRRIGDMTISMKGCGCLKMPEMITTTAEVEMGSEEQQKYEAMKRELALRTPEGKVTAANAAVLTGKLLQLASGAIYGDDGQVIRIHDRKLDALEDIIEEMNGRPLLVGYWFRHDRERIMGRLKKIGVAFERLDTEESIRRWNTGRIAVGLAHPAATGHGLNLQEGGNTLCWFSPTWSLELYQQMNARLFRQGQKAETVVITHIVTRGTMDGRVLAALARKDRIQEGLIEAVKAEIR